MCSFSIEIGLAVAGVLLLALGAPSASNLNRKVVLAAIGVTALSLLLMLTGETGGPAWTAPFYATDGLSVFYKTFALVTTLVVLVLALESDLILAWFSSSEGIKTRIGEFYALPLITCAGMMWMASAKDGVRLRSAGTGDREFLRAGGLHPPQCRLARSWCKIPDSWSAEHRYSGLRDRLDLRCHRLLEL